MAEGSSELARKYRPRELAQVVGQTVVVSVLTKMLERRAVPHCLLFVGPSGVGKTTIARIVAKNVGCLGSDLHEINCASLASPMDTVKTIQECLVYPPRVKGGKAVGWILDEVQSFSRAQFAQQALLKMLEEPKKEAYFFLCTTDPAKIIPTVRNRCTELSLRLLTSAELTGLITFVLRAENSDISPKVIAKIVQTAKGSARACLVLLQKVLAAGSEQEALGLVVPGEMEVAAFDVVKALLYERTTWAEMVKILAVSQEMEQESLRHFILSVARTEVLKDNKRAGRAYQILDAFRETWRDCQESGLVQACFEILRSK